jgi:capsular polysaccharide biosynthesis protein
VSERALDLRQCWHIVRQHWKPVGVLAALGLIVGAGYTAFNPPMFSSSALVALPTSAKDIATQVVVAGSDPVLARALGNPDPGESLQTLRQRVHVTEMTPNILSVGATGDTAPAAVRTANRVAASYVAYVHTKGSAGGVVAANLFQPAVEASSQPVAAALGIACGIGVLAGALVGAIFVLARFRGDRRLWRRDDIADAVGAPVLASLPVWRPTNAANWADLIGTYKPDIAHAWRVRNALHYLGLSRMISDRTPGPDGFSVTVLSLTCDRRALALGPQLAASAAAQGVATTLIVGPQPHADENTAALRSAVASHPPKRAGLRVAVADDGVVSPAPGAALTVVVSVVNPTSEPVGTPRTGATLLGLAAGSVTAEQLAIVASRAAAHGNPIDGVIVADPDPADGTTGRVPQVTRSAHRVTPNRLTSVATEPQC